ncbi:MAG: DciA family protein [Woeseiaceae bacterium]|jgi:hypothetical protein
MADKPLKDLLNPTADGDLGDIVRRARRLGELTDNLCKSLGEEFSGAIVAANLRENGELVIIAASSAWASRLRYETDVLLEAARVAGVEPTACRIRVTQS